MCIISKGRRDLEADAKEGEVNDLFKDQLTSRSCFRNLHLSNNAQLETGKMTAYVTMPGVIRDILGRLNKLSRQDLRDKSKAKHILSTGGGEGSLLDLIQPNKWDRVPINFVGCLHNAR